MRGYSKKRSRSQPTLRHYPAICLEELRKATQKVIISFFWSEIWTRDLVSTKQHVNHSAATFVSMSNGGSFLWGKDGQSERTFTHILLQSVSVELATEACNNHRFGGFEECTGGECRGGMKQGHLSYKWDFRFSRLWRSYDTWGSLTALQLAYTLSCSGDGMYTQLLETSAQLL
jgi:hypothetical protein